MIRTFITITLIISISLSCLFFVMPVLAFDLQSAAFSLSAESKDINNLTETQKIEELLDNLENDWNLHDVDKVAKHYADGFANGDGLGIDAVKKLTQELWDAYPDIQCKSKERTIRINGEYATVENTDVYQGNSKTIRSEVGTKGVLKAIASGNTFLKKFGPIWKITSDKTIFEKVSISYGIGSELTDKNKIVISAPEQVVGGQQYTARLDLDLPKEIKAVAAISKELLIYPQLTAEDKFRLIDEPKLERLLYANKISKNELLTTTVGLTGGPLNPKLLGLVFLSKRVNVIPLSQQVAELSIIKEPAKSSLTKTNDLLDTYPSTNNNDDQNQIKNQKENDSSESDDTDFKE